MMHGNVPKNEDLHERKQHPSTDPCRYPRQKQTMEVDAAIMEEKLQMTAEKTLVLSCFLTLDTWDKIVNSVGIYGPQKQVVNKVQLDKNLGNQHKKHFRQAQGTPFTVSPLSELFWRIPGHKFHAVFCQRKSKNRQIGKHIGTDKRLAKGTSSKTH